MLYLQKRAEFLEILAEMLGVSENRSFFARKDVAVAKEQTLDNLWLAQALYDLGGNSIW